MQLGETSNGGMLYSSDLEKKLWAGTGEACNLGIAGFLNRDFILHYYVFLFQILVPIYMFCGANSINIFVFTQFLALDILKGNVTNVF